MILNARTDAVTPETGLGDDLQVRFTGELSSMMLRTVISQH